MNYPHFEIWINGRLEKLSSIISGTSIAGTDAEQHTFDFIRQWCSNEPEFRLFTSGSTGTPKTIEASREQLTASALSTIETVGLNSAMNALVCLDTRYIAGKMMIVRSFVAGMRMFIVDPSSDPGGKLPADVSIDFVALVPLQIKNILESKHPQLLRDITICLIGGAPLDDSTADKLSKLPGQFYVTYGMTETFSHVALKKISTPVNDRFRTLEGISVSKDERDCLVVHVPFIDAAVVTNDVVEIFNNREFVWKGRADNMINSGGVKISPEVLERRIGQIFTRLKLQNRFFIHHRPDDMLGQRIVLVIEAPLPDGSTRRLIKESIDHTLPPFERVKEFYECAAFTETETQKINRQKSFLSSRLAEGFFN